MEIYHEKTIYHEQRHQTNLARRNHRRGHDLWVFRCDLYPRGFPEGGDVMISYRKLQAFMILLSVPANDNNRDLLMLIARLWGKI